MSNWSYGEEYVQKLGTAYRNIPSLNASDTEIVMWIDSCLYKGNEGLKTLFSLSVEQCDAFINSTRQLSAKYNFGLTNYTYYKGWYHQILEYVRASKIDADAKKERCEQCRQDVDNQDCMEYNGPDQRECSDIANEIVEERMRERNSHRDAFNNLLERKINLFVRSTVKHAEIPNSGDETIEGLTDLTDSIWGTVITIVQALAVGSVIFAGLRYMYASAEKKADIKKSMMYLVIGALFVFATSSVMRFIFSIGNSLL